MSAEDEELTPLKVRIEDAIDQFTQERHRIGSHSESERRAITAADALAQVLLDASISVTLPAKLKDDGSFWDVVTNFAGELEPLVLERLQVDFAWRFLPETARMAERCVELTRAVVGSQPSQLVVSSLARLSRCYILGFEAEVAILARVVLEGALRDAYARRAIPLPATAENRSELTQFIQSALKLGFVSRDAAREADKLRLRGNKLAHGEPLDAPPAAETLRALMVVLSELYPVD